MEKRRALSNRESCNCCSGASKCNYTHNLFINNEAFKIKLWTFLNYAITTSTVRRAPFNAGAVVRSAAMSRFPVVFSIGCLVYGRAMAPAVERRALLRAWRRGAQRGRALDRGGGDADKGGGTGRGGGDGSRERRRATRRLRLKHKRQALRASALRGCPVRAWQRGPGRTAGRFPENPTASSHSNEMNV